MVATFIRTTALVCHVVLPSDAATTSNSIAPGKPQSWVSKSENAERRVDAVEFADLAALYKKPMEELAIAEVRSKRAGGMRR